MRPSWPTWVRRQSKELLYRGCSDITDPDRRREAALQNVTAYVGIAVSTTFIVINVTAGKSGVAAILTVAALIMVLSVLVRHRTHQMEPSAWMGLSAAGVFFIYVLARADNSSAGLIWANLFPLLAMFTLGHRNGTLASGVYLLLVGVLVLVPNLPGVTAGYSLETAIRLLFSVMFAGVIAFHYELAGATARTRLKAEIEVRRRAETELRASGEETKRVSQAKSDFLAALSHEVRTPLTAIMGLNDTLLHSELNAEQRRSVELTNSTGRGLIAVMEEILDLAKVEAGKVVLVPVPFDLHALATDIVELHQVLVRPQPVQVKLDWRPDLPRFVVGDPNRLRQVLTNFMSNALKFTAVGEIVLSAEREASTSDRVSVVLAVADTGTGLAPEMEATLFRPFSQGAAGRQRGGAGLGLAISKRLVEAMGGEIGVGPLVGRGAKFWIRLTLPIADGPVETTAPCVGAFRGRVLVADDNALNRDVLRAMIERMGCVVDTANDGVEALSACTAHHYDLVLMDCQMPKLDGFAATRRIRELQDAGSRTPIVAITAFALSEDTKRCQDAGMDGHLIKPLTPEAVADALQQWLQTSEAADAK